MSYIITSTNPFVSVKLTEKGREQLSLGQLNFSYWAIGDSELNYDRETIVDANQTDVVLSATSRILRPFDRQPNIKSFIKPANATTNYQQINSSNMNVIRAVVNNQATERGFFNNALTSFTTSLLTTITPFNQEIQNTTLTGSNLLTLSGSPIINNGDILLLKLSNSVAGGIQNDDTTIALPNLWFKVQGITGNTFEVDRNLPNYSADTGSSQIIVYRGGEIYDTIATGTTTAYWDTGTLSFNSSINVTCHDVPVWNMNNVWCENIIGLSGNSIYEDYTKFGSYTYLGSKNPYLEYMCQLTGETNSEIDCTNPGTSISDPISKSISIIHYTNNAISNLYGEYFYVDATNNKIVKLHLPNIMYHRSQFATASGTTMGVTFIASGQTNFIGNSDIEYIDLVEENIIVGSRPLRVGKVFPQLKMIVIDNDEIVAALSYKSNRNWTLPGLAATLQAPSGGTSTGILQPDETIYLTYYLENNGISGLTNSLPCQTYTMLTNTTLTSKDVSFIINGTDQLPYMRKKELIGYDGLGFYATNFKLLYQITSGTTRPDSGQWKEIDYTSNAITVNNGETIDPKLLEIQTPTTNGFILDANKITSATTFNVVPVLNLPLNSEPNKLQFGDERFFYGNLETYIGATIYKTIFDIQVNSSLFNTTTNPTRSTDPTMTLPTIKISEVGIFDINQNLIAIGKLSKPVPLIAGNTIMLELSIDF